MDKFWKPGRVLAGCLALAACGGAFAPTARAADWPELVIPRTCGVQLKRNNYDAANLDQIKAAGFGMVRRSFYWEAVEKEKGAFDFTECDAFVKNCRERGLAILFTLYGGNKLYGDGKVTSPEGRAGFANYAAALAKHYKDENMVFEIWNEPNVRTFWGWQRQPGAKGAHNSEPFADEYLALVRETVAAMKKANPACKVMGGATSNIWSASYRWMGFCFGKGALKTGIDAWSVHPYSLKCPEDYIAAYAQIRKMMTEAGAPGTTIINSERGYPVKKDKEGFAGGKLSETDEYQAWHIVRQYLVDLSCEVPITVWYEWGGNEGFGIAPGKDGKDTKALRAARVMLAELSGYRLEKRLPTTNDRDFALLFVNGEKAHKIVAWTAPAPEQSPDKAVAHAITIPVDAKGEATAVSLYGEKSTLPVQDGKVTITVSGAPQYVY